MIAAVVGPGEVWGAWVADPLAAVALLLGGFAYLRGVERLWRRSGRGRVVQRWQVHAFAGGWLTLAAALLSPIDALAGTLLTAHMVQHLLLALVAAPLLVLAAPALPLAQALPEGGRRLVHRWRLPARWRRRVVSPAATAVACLAYVAVLWVWHLPVLYEAALRSSVVHLVEHGMMLGTAVWLWSSVLHRGGPVRRSTPVAALAMFVTATLTVGLGALLTLTPGAWYATYEAGARAWGMTALEDQQRAGALMWSIGGIATTIAGAVSFGAWLSAEHRRLGVHHVRPHGCDADHARPDGDVAPPRKRG